MNSNPAEIGQRIKEARKAAKLSQTELAGQLEKTLRTVQKYESGEIEPSIATINSIAKILNASPADIHALAPLVEAVLADHQICVVGAEQALSQATDVLDEVVSLFG